VIRTDTFKQFFVRWDDREICVVLASIRFCECQSSVICLFIVKKRRLNWKTLCLVGFIAKNTVRAFKITYLCSEFQCGVTIVLNECGFETWKNKL